MMEFLKVLVLTCFMYYFLLDCSILIVVLLYNCSYYYRTKRTRTMLLRVITHNWAQGRESYTRQHSAARASE